jgi:hypothetical protein
MLSYSTEMTLAVNPGLHALARGPVFLSALSKPAAKRDRCKPAIDDRGLLTAATIFLRGTHDDERNPPYRGSLRPTAS